MKRNFNEIYQEIYKNGVKELTILKRNHNVSILVFFALFTFNFGKSKKSNQ